MARDLREWLSGKLEVGIPVVLFFLVLYLIITNVGVLRQLATGYGLAGLFLASLLANATVLLPVPIDVAIVAINAVQGSLFQAVVVAVVVGVGAAIGEMTAYYAGMLGVRAAEKMMMGELDRVDEFRARLEEMGALFVFLGALLPLPFDVIGITAGFIRFDVRKFFAAALCGKVGRYVLLSAAAFYGFGLARSLHLLQ